MSNTDRRTVRVPVCDKLLWTASELAAVLSVSRSAIIEMNRYGLLPRPLRLNRNTVRYRADEVKAWLTAGAPSIDGIGADRWRWKPESDAKLALYRAAQPQEATS